MRLLIQNYNNSISSKPTYFNHCLAQIESSSSALWDVRRTSVYDIMDSFQPDAILINYTGLNSDLYRYLKKEKRIDTILDLTSAPASMLGKIGDIIRDFDLPIKFIMLERPKQLGQIDIDLKQVNLLPASDIFASSNSAPDFKIEGCCIGRIDTKSFQDACSGYKSYHKILIRDYLNQGNRNNFDMEVDIVQMRSLYDKYDEVTVNGDMNYIFSQLFFDSIMFANKISLKYPEEQKGLFTEILSSIFEDTGEEPSISSIRKQIKEKHTCVDRCSEFLSLLGDSESSKEVLKLK